MNPSAYTSSVRNSLLRRGIDPAKNLRRLSTSARRSDSCRTRSFASRLVLQVHPPLKDGPEAGALENKSSFSAPLALSLLPPSPSPCPACPLPCVTHIYAVLARWSRGSLWSGRALWSYSLKGLGEREREEFIFASEETYGLNQKATAKSYSFTLHLH